MNMLMRLMTGMILMMVVAETAQAERRRENTEWVISYSYNANDNRLPRVLLIGDSICNGYQSLVRNQLAGTANVSFYATSKCVSDRTYLRELDYFLDEYDYAVIHFNNGLHSLGTDRREWEAGLRAALDLIKTKGKGAKVIWATSTPLKKPELTRKAEELNAIAARVVREYRLPVDDLFAAMAPLDRNRYWVDVYHYNHEGKEIQARQVADCIRTVLGGKAVSASAAAAALKSAASDTGPDGRIATTSEVVVPALKNADFEASGNWNIYPADPAKGSLSFDSAVVHGGKNAAKIQVKSPGLQFYQSAPVLEPGSSCRIGFWARSDKPSRMVFNLRTRQPPYVFLGKSTFDLTPEWREFETMVKLPADFNSQAYVWFFVFPETGTFFVDDISVRKR